MTAYDRNLARTHDDILERIADALDIPSSLFEKAQSRYQSIGEWLGREGSSLAAYEPAISPQGSFLLGTVTRPLTDEDEYDVDAVCRLHATKSDFTQKQLKEAVGREVLLYAQTHNMNKPVAEGRRCWTLHYADGARFHMDILPALPDAGRYRLLLEQHGYRSLAESEALAGQAIAITDKTSPTYEIVTDDWPQSNPSGYAAWFRMRMIAQLTERKRALAEAQGITASVDDIPDYRVKTPLQRTVQLLKRHRDCMFGCDDHRPISVIITTLAAHAYNEEPTIAAALQSILTRMDQFIDDRNGVAWVANPVNPAENFADKWAEEPRKEENFRSWLEQARQDFALYLRASRFDEVPEVLKEGLGRDIVDDVLGAIAPASAMALAAPAIVRSDADAQEARAEAAIRERQSMGAQSKPWAKR